MNKKSETKAGNLARKKGVISEKQRRALTGAAGAGKKEDLG